MKKLILNSLSIFVILANMLMMQSCNEDDDAMIWDIYPIEAYINVVDENGVSIFEGITSEELINEGIYATYDGEDHPLHFKENELESGESRAILPKFTGLTMVERNPYLNDITAEQFDSGNCKNLRMTFGQLEGAGSNHYIIYFHFPRYDKTFKFEFIRSFGIKKNELDIKDQAILDGKILEDHHGPYPQIEIVLNSADRKE